MLFIYVLFIILRLCILGSFKHDFLMSNNDNSCKNKKKTKKKYNQNQKQKQNGTFINVFVIWLP